ncbi:hypothetical protein FRC02_001217 [Tulasnella sp. 418]|nr:hypothetical protein FRC02_001217 [Tulasnella sp. 418]
MSLTLITELVALQVTNTIKSEIGKEKSKLFSNHLIPLPTAKPLEPGQWMASCRPNTAVPTLSVSKSDSSNAETLYIEAPSTPIKTKPLDGSTASPDRQLDNPQTGAAAQLKYIRRRVARTEWSESTGSITAEAGSQLNLESVPTPKLGSISPMVFAQRSPEAQNIRPIPHSMRRPHTSDGCTLRQRGPPVQDTTGSPRRHAHRHSCGYRKIQERKAPELWPYDGRSLYAHHPEDPRSQDVPSERPSTAPAATKIQTEETKTPPTKSKFFLQAKLIWRVFGLHKLSKTLVPKHESRMPNSAIPHPNWGDFKFRSDDDDLRSEDSDGDLEIWLKHRQLRNAQILGDGHIRIHGTSIEHYEKFGSQAHLHARNRRPHKSKRSKRPSTAPEGPAAQNPGRPRYTGGHCHTCSQMRPPAPPGFTQLAAHRNRSNPSEPATSSGVAIALTAPSLKHYIRDISRYPQNRNAPSRLSVPSEPHHSRQPSFERSDGRTGSYESRPVTEQSKLRLTPLPMPGVGQAFGRHDRISEQGFAMSHLELDAREEKSIEGQTDPSNECGGFGLGSASSFGRHK